MANQSKSLIFDLVTSVIVSHHSGLKQIKWLNGDQRWEAMEPINDGEKNERHVFVDLAEHHLYG